MGRLKVVWWLFLVLGLVACGEVVTPTAGVAATAVATSTIVAPTAPVAEVVDSYEVLSLTPPEADERIAYGADPLQFGDLRLPEGAGPHPVVVVIHGGYWLAEYDLTYSGFMAEAITAAGAATWNIEYRRLGDDEGGWPGTFEDVAAATDYLRTIAPTYDLDLGRVVVIGHSAGGQLALWLAGRGNIVADSALKSAEPLPVKGVVSLAGVADLERGYELSLGNGVVRRLLGGAPEDMGDRYAATSPLALLPLGVPQVMIHGGNDLIVPLEISEEYVDAAVAVGDKAEMVELPGGHFEIVDPRTSQWATVLGRVLELLK